MSFGIYFNIGGLQVSMDDALFVRGFQCLGDLLGEGEGFIHGNWAAPNALSKGFPLDKLHDQEGLAFGFLDFIESSDSGMIQRGE